MRRTLVHELMDDPGVDRDELAASLRYIRLVNRLAGGSAAMIGHLERWSRRWPRDRPVTMLDVATGSADIPLAARRWARSRGFDLRITAVDLHEKTLDLARAHVAGDEGIIVLHADALALDARFDAGAFDYAHAGMFLHHLREEQIEVVLRSMDRVARAGIVWNDLVRSRLHHALISLMVVGQPWIVRHDARVSVRAGFTRQECEAFAQRLGLSYLAYHHRPLWYRFTMAGEKPDAWA